MTTPSTEATRWTRAKAVLALTPVSAALLGVVCVSMLVVIAAEWRLAHAYFVVVGADWLLIGIFVVMLALLVFGADWRVDAPLMVVAFVGGVVIESWGTQTRLWQYYTELPPWNDPSRPPWWILPAWPIATLAINRLYLLLDALTHDIPTRLLGALYGLFIALFAVLFYLFSAPAWSLSSTRLVAAVVVCVLLCPPFDLRRGALVLLAGGSLGYFLELWGTTRQCWVYYTGETPPLFAAVAHGVSSLAFTRGVHVLGAARTRLLSLRRELSLRTRERATRGTRS